jgi:hypothetical protein
MIISYENRHIFCHRCIRKIINSLLLRRKIASQFSSSAYVQIMLKIDLLSRQGYDHVVRLQSNLHVLAI